MGADSGFSVTARQVGMTCLSALAILLSASATAGAAVTCTYEAGAEVLQVTMTADNDRTALDVGGGGAIQVRGGGPILSCAGGSPTLANTEFVSVFDNSGGGSTGVSIFEPADFAATTKINLVMGGGIHDRLYLAGSPVGDQFVLGTAGVDSDAISGADVNFVSAPEEIEADGGDGADILSAQGGSGTGAAISAAFVTLAGEIDNDTLSGSEAGDLLEGGAGNDTMRGFGGAELLIGDEITAGDDTIEGGPGTDHMIFPLAPGAVTVDLGKTTAQATGQGNDTITQVENVDGTSLNDVLIGDAGPNQLLGGAGDDEIDGGGDADVLDGSIGVDTVSYANAPAAVAVNLGAGTASGGAGTDTLTEIENLVGSPFSDALTGSAAANEITALAGSDTVNALSGADLVDVRDASADSASCGADADRAVSDRRSLDTIQADCEAVDALPEAGGAGANSGIGVVADTKLDFRLTGARRQKLLEQKGILVRLRCPEEACAIFAKASGRLPKLAPPIGPRRLKVKAVEKQLPAGPARPLKLRLNRARLAAIEARLVAGKSPKIKVTVRATDGAGNVVRRKLTVIAKL